jgi:hypothetical protein
MPATMTSRKTICGILSSGRERKSFDAGFFLVIIEILTTMAQQVNRQFCGDLHRAKVE